MAFVLLGLVFLAMKVLEVGPGAGWPWWGVLAPFAAAVAWWSFADSMGLTQRRAMRKIDDKQAKRRADAMAALGQDPHRDQRAQAARAAARKASNKAQS